MYGLSCFDAKDVDANDDDDAGDAANVCCCVGYGAEIDFLGAAATGAA